MAGYSATPLARKLGIKEGAVIGFRGAPPGFHNLVDPLPEGVTVRARAAGRLDVLVAFFTRIGELERRFPTLARSIYPDGGLWIGWPKRSSGVETDLSEDAVRELALPLGLVDNKVCAIDDTWSGLRVVFRVENRGR